MKRLAFIFFAALLCVALNVHAQVVKEAQEELNYQAAIAKDQKAEKPRYDYVFFLYTKKRFQDARKELKFLFGINSRHVGGRKLLKSMDDVDGLADIQYQDQQMRLFMVEKAKIDKEEEAAEAEHSGSLTPDRIAKIQSDLDKRYRFSDRMNLETKPAEAENKFQTDFATQIRSNQYAEAEKTARNWITTFEKSPIAKADFGAFLILRDRFVQAEVLLSDARKRNPECLKLQIIADLLTDIKSAKSSERNADLKGRLNDELAVYQLTANGQLEEAKRAPTGVPAKTVSPNGNAPPQPQNGAIVPQEPPQPQTVNGLPAVITPEDIEKMNVKPTMHRRK